MPEVRNIYSFKSSFIRNSASTMYDLEYFYVNGGGGTKHVAFHTYDLSNVLSVTLAMPRMYLFSNSSTGGLVHEFSGVDSAANEYDYTPGSTNKADMAVWSGSFSGGVIDAAVRGFTSSYREWAPSSAEWCFWQSGSPDDFTDLTAWVNTRAGDSHATLGQSDTVAFHNWKGFRGATYSDEAFRPYLMITGEFAEESSRKYSRTKSRIINRLGSRI